MGPEHAEPAAGRVLVVACGNTLRGDDAVGSEIAELLAAELEGAGVLLIVTDQLLPELAEDASRSRRVVFVDAAADRPAGSVGVEAVTVGAESFEPGAALSPAVRSAIPSAARAVLAAVRAGPWRSADA